MSNCERIIGLFIAGVVGIFLLMVVIEILKSKGTPGEWMRVNNWFYF